MLVEELFTSIRINQVATPAVSLLKDVTGMATLAYLIGWFFPNFLINNATGLPYSRDDFEGKDDKGWVDFIETQNLVAIGAAGGLAFFTGGLSLGAAAIWGIIVGTVVQEGVEEVVEAATDAKQAAIKQARLIKLYFTFTDPDFSTAALA